MRRIRRKTEVFSLSFLDCICCGFGAVVLIYMIVTASVTRRVETATGDRRAEVSRVEEQLLEGWKDLVELRNSLKEVEARLAETRGLSRRVLDDVARTRDELATFSGSSLARRQSLEKLKSDLRTLEQETKRLSALAPSDETPGDRVRSFVGDGDRQYLTGLKVGGERILLLVDASASMLDDTVVNVVRRRNLADAVKVRADKWQQAVRTVDWLTTQIPRSSQFQVYIFRERAEPLLPGSAGRWLDGSSRDDLDAAVGRLRQVVPGGGTSLENAFLVVAELRPPPDNVILLTDGLPTQGREQPRGKTVSGKKRLELFERAVRVLPARLPVNVVLLPMEGDPKAPSAFWKLALASGGSYIAPARDWP